MEPSKAERLEQAVATLTALIREMEQSGLPDSAHFLAMARMHVMIDLNEITDLEFRALCIAVEDKARKPRSAPLRAPPGRSRRDGELRAMHRAWRCPQDAPQRPGRRRAGQ